MARLNLHNPFAFRPLSVTVFTTVTYLAIAVLLLYTHEIVPPAPKPSQVPDGLNTTQAWLDLTTLTRGFHPYNSKRNDEVRDWLLMRIESILDENDVQWTTQTSMPPSSRADAPAVVVFNDLLSNVTCSAAGVKGTTSEKAPGQSVYFEGTNIIVYIRGTEDDQSDWWKSADITPEAFNGKGGVLVNAHYDSVSTGYGATDDGVGVITVLQLIQYFTTPGNEPRRGVVALLNNGEEDFLNGARAYTQHPMSAFTHTFLNLEGAGAGGRATLFRTTDTEVTKAYAGSKNPFGTVVSGDSFKTGAIRSQTDYVVFEGILGLRGLDLAFWYPRARYHTNQDDARHTSVDSLWHMLSASVTTMKSLTSSSSKFDGPRGDGTKGKVRNGHGSDAVWTDIFGKAFIVFGLHGLFAWSLTILITGPIILMAITIILIRQDKFYFFAIKATPGGSKDHATSLYGWRGAFFFPVALVASTALVFGSAYLVNKLNPLIAYSSLYAIWSMMLSLWFIVFWFIAAAANAIRPSALQRGFGFLWMFILGWAALVAATVYEDRFHIAGVYFIVFFQSAAFLATLISLCEQFALPHKAKYAEFTEHEEESRHNIEGMPDSQGLLAPPSNEPGQENGDHEEANESTPLIGGGSRAQSPGPATTFAHYARRSLGGGDAVQDGKEDFDEKHKAYGNEQKWSGTMPTWTWLLQFLLVAPITVILVGQIGLLTSFSVAQTGADGSSTLLPYLLVACCSTMILLPVSPFIHRFTPHIPVFLFVIFLAALLYNLTAFPFSPNNRYKVYFQQTVDLESGINQVTLTGLEEYVRPIVASLPSSAGQEIKCEKRSDVRTDLTACAWSGIPPRVIENMPIGVPPEKGYGDWLTFNATRHAGQNSARFIVSGKNTRACAIRFARPISDVRIAGSADDDRFDRVPEGGSSQVKLWHREWESEWVVDVEWAPSEGKQKGEEGMEGRVVCLWSDANTPGTIPALDEVRMFSADWSAVTKLSDGLVEGSKPFNI